MFYKSEFSMVSLSKALKIKNRLAGRLANLQSNIQSYNSSHKGMVNTVNIRELDEERKKFVDALVALKSAIYIANQEIYIPLAKLEEKKNEINFLKQLSTKHGTEPGYQGSVIEYVAVIQQTEVEKRVKQLEKEIDELQDVIDAHNAKSERVGITTQTLELAS